MCPSDLSMAGWFKPYEPADSPGPIPKVIDRFRRRPFDRDELRDRANTTLARYTLVLVTPTDATRLGLTPDQSGLMLFVDTALDGCKESFEQAVRDIEEDCGLPIVLVEHRADLTYWTAQWRAPSSDGNNSVDQGSSRDRGGIDAEQLPQHENA